jgi:anaerobic ribonucleoside-triphosphate reductase activating protein
MFNPGYLKVGAFTTHCEALGFGVRSVLWVTGCNRRCPGCIKPDFLSFDAGVWKDTEDVISWILNSPSTAGLTISGGEPFEQSVELSKLCRRVRKQGRDVLVYTGFRLEYLLSVSKYDELLETIDWIIDGEYRENLVQVNQFRGSANQRLWFRTKEGNFVEANTDNRIDIQVAMTTDQIRLSGFPNQAFISPFKAALNKRGLELQDAKHEVFFP